jgi:hypothetical protein
MRQQRSSWGKWRRCTSTASRRGRLPRRLASCGFLLMPLAAEPLQTTYSSTLSALATDEDIVQRHFGYHRVPRHDSSTDVSFLKNRPAHDNYRLGSLQRAVTEYTKDRIKPFGKDGNPMVCRSRGFNSTEHFQYSGKYPVEKARRKQGLSNVHMAYCIVDDVAKGMDIWD